MAVRVYWLLGMGALAVLLAACGSGAPPAVEQPPVWTVHITPSMRWAEPALSQCMLGQTGAALMVEERAAPFVDSMQADLVLRWGAPPAGDGPGSYAGVVGWDDLVLVVHPDNPLNALQREEVQMLFSGRVENWKDLPSNGGAWDAAVQPWGYGRGEDMQVAFAQALMDGQAMRYQVAADPPAMLQSVAADSGAIGLASRRWLAGPVRLLPVKGIDAEMLRFPLIAAAQQAPDGAMAAWLLCLQERFQ